MTLKTILILNGTLNKAGLCNRSRMQCKLPCHLTDLIELEVSLEDRDRLIRILQGSMTNCYRKWQYRPLVFWNKDSSLFQRTTDHLKLAMCMLLNSVRH